MASSAPAAPDLSATARQRILDEDGGPFLRCAWRAALVAHYQVRPALLPPALPFALDERGGWAYVSLRAFLVADLRLGTSGRWLRWTGPLGPDAGVVSLAAAVRHDGEAGWYFLGQWLGPELRRLAGPRTFGVPGQWAAVQLRHDPATELSGSVELDASTSDAAPAPAPGNGNGNGNGRGQARGRLAYRAVCPAPAPAPGAAAQVSAPGSLDEFLNVRYAIFTTDGPVRRRLRYWHEPWLLAPLDLSVQDDSLLTTVAPWLGEARLLGASFSAGAPEVWLGRPRCIQGPACAVSWHELDE